MLHLVVCLMLCVAMFGQQRAVGTWALHRAYGNATSTLMCGGRVVQVASGNLFVYDPEDEVTTTLDALNGLNGYGVTHCAYSRTTGTVIVVYEDGLIDLMDIESLQATPVTGLRDKNMASKTVNGIVTSDTDARAWVLTSFGLLELDLKALSAGECYDFGTDVCSAAELDGLLYYCVRDDGMYRARIGMAMHDRANHTRLNSHVYIQMESMEGKIFCRTGPVINVLTATPDGASIVKAVDMRARNMQVCGRRLLLTGTSEVAVVEGGGVTRYAAPANVLDATMASDGTLWASGGLEGLLHLAAADGSMEQVGGGILPNSPRYDYFYRMGYAGNRLMVAGGAHEYGGHEEYEGTAAIYEDGTWRNLDTVMIGKEPFVNLTGIAQDPEDAETHYVTSRGHGLYVYKDGKVTARKTWDNSPLVTIVAGNPYNYVRVNAPTFDSEGRLWMLNCEVDTVLRWWNPRTDKWGGIYIEDIAGARCADGLHFDGQGRIWVLVRDMGGRGILCYDPDRRKYLLTSSITQQDGLTYAPDNFLCMAADRDGQLWVGTEQGLFVLEHPEDFPALEWTQIKVNRDDGSGLADYMLSGAYVTAIAVDGANRKWIGTLGSGVYLVSADGQEMLEHFTSDNSPLPSDDIRCVTVNPSTGEVMIGCVGGLASYMGDATEPESELKKDNIVIFPNPVRPEYGGRLNIRGLTHDAEVKIATVTGQVVWSGRSAGGALTWDLRSSGGTEVGTGVYNVIVCTPEGTETAVKRLAVVR